MIKIRTDKFTFKKGALHIELPSEVVQTHDWSVVAAWWDDLIEATIDDDPEGFADSVFRINQMQALIIFASLGEQLNEMKILPEATVSIGTQDALKQLVGRLNGHEKI